MPVAIRVLISGHWMVPCPRPIVPAQATAVIFLAFHMLAFVLRGQSSRQTGVAIIPYSTVISSLATSALWMRTSL